MSLEESMEKLADSNLKLAKSFDRYADVVEKFGLQIEKSNEGKTPAAAGGSEGGDAGEATGGKTRGRPPSNKDKPASKEKPAPKEKPTETGKGGDGFDDDDEGDGDEEIVAPKDLSHDQVKRKLLDVRDALDGDKEPALDLIREFGYETIPSIKEKHFAPIWVAAEKKLREINGD